MSLAECGAMTTTRTYPKRAATVLCALAALALLSAFAANPAHAWNTKYPEPAYTKTSGNNSFWFRWNAESGVTGSSTDWRYYVCANTYMDNAQVESHNGTAGPGAANCTGLLVNSAWTTRPSGDIKWMPFSASTVLQDGHYYSMCSTGFLWYSYAGWTQENTNSDNCVGTVIDRNKPQTQVAVNGTADRTNNPQLQFSIAYQDATSPPWKGSNGYASNWTCISRGGPCTPGGNPDNDCSVPTVANSRNNAFYCQGDFSAQPDGDYYFCAFAADSAVPDNPNGTNQSGTSNQANLSDIACGHVVLDRTGPSVTANASATSATVGQLVTFSGSASDPAGVQSAYDWDFGDNTGHGSGATTTHTYTQPGTYQVKLNAKDAVGNNGQGTVTVNVVAAGGGTPPPPAGGGGGSTPPAGTPTGTTGATATTTPVTTTVISQQSGGGGAQSASLGGALDVIAPRKLVAGKQLLLALTPDTAGSLQVSLLKGSKVVARKAAVFGAGGTYSVKVKVPAKVKPGTYRLKLSFTPKGANKAIGKALRLKVVKAKAARRKIVPISHEGDAPKGTAVSFKQPRHPAR
jgi:plastocyanin